MSLSAPLLRTLGLSILLFLLVPLPGAGQQHATAQAATPDESAVARALAPAPSPLLAGPPRSDLARHLAPAGAFPGAFTQPDERRRNLSLIAAGVTLLVAGAFIDDTAGTVVMVSGAALAATGVYRWVR